MYFSWKSKLFLHELSSDHDDRKLRRSWFFPNGSRSYAFFYRHINSGWSGRTLSIPYDEVVASCLRSIRRIQGKVPFSWTIYWEATNDSYVTSSLKHLDFSIRSYSTKSEEFINQRIKCNTRTRNSFYTLSCFIALDGKHWKDFCYTFCAIPRRSNFTTSNDSNLKWYWQNSQTSYANIIYS